MRTRAHRRQFVLAPYAVLAAPDWTTVTLANGMVFSHCPDLRIARVADGSGAEWMLLGHALSIEGGGADPLKAMARVRSDAVPALTDHWTGRWLLIGPDAIYPDASALLGCLYCRDPQGALVISSSAALLASIGREETAPLADPRRLVHERGLSWYPPPCTRFAGMRRLLPSQRLIVGDGSVAPRRLMPPVSPAENEDERLEEIVAALTIALSGLAGLSQGPIWLGLTAGKDSRTMLAIAARAGARMRPFTRLTPRMSVADRVLPPRLACLAGYRHDTMSDRPVGYARHAMLRTHAADAVSEDDVLPFLAGVREGLDGILIGGHGFEIATGQGNLRKLPADLPPPGDAEAILLHFGEPADSPAAKGLREWLRWVPTTPVPGLDWRDRFYLEQREAGWAAAKEQIYDMQDVVRLPLVNCAALHAALLSLPRQSRQSPRPQSDIVARSAPPLATLPYNPKDTEFLTRHPSLVLRRRLYFARRRLRERIGA